MADNRHDDLLERVRGTIAAEEPSHERLASMRAHVSHTKFRNATTLRDAPSNRWWWIAGTIAAAAAILIAVLLLPEIDRRTTVSASEILGRSRAALATPGTGIEVVTSDLSVDGVLAELLPAEQSGQFTIQETIDHERPGRYRLLKIASNGEIVGGIADDLSRGIRTRYLRAQGRGYLLRFTGHESAFSIAELKRMALQALITLMQAEANPALRETTCDGEPCYEITLPSIESRDAALVSLSSGRALITAQDARLVGMSVTGQMAGRPFGLEFTQRSRTTRTGPSAQDAFELTAQPGDIVLEGNASSNPVWDVVQRALAAIPAPPAR